ncbi:MAG TPA: hypothetical protein DCM68_07855, partial [Verrucomicrobia bacterium]|nr:hypothetical protein [Verrucomicrobiota bacterium]
MSQTTYSDTVSVASGRELLGRRVSLYDHTKDVAGRPVTFVEIIDGILGGKWKASVDKVRAESDEDRQKEIKKTLPGFTAAGVFKRRNKTSIELPAGLVVIDIDGLGSYEKAVEVRDTLADDPHVVAGFVSVRGEGVKLIVYAGEIATDAEFKAAWRAFAEYAADNYGLSLDPSGKDICRLCFVSNDRGAFVNTGEVRAFTARMEIEQELPQCHSDTTGTEEAATSGTAIPDGMRAVNEMPSPDAPPVANVRAALCHLDPAMERDGWLRIAMALKSVYPGKEGFALFDEWSKRAPDRYGGTVEVWNSIERDGGVTLGTLYASAEARGWVNPTGKLYADLRRAKAEDAEADEEATANPLAGAKSLAELARLPINHEATLLGERFLCRRGCMLYVGRSGLGKSSGSAQQDVGWSLGRQAFGIVPKRPLNILCIQAENDDGDLHEMALGVMRGLELTDIEWEQVEQRTTYDQWFVSGDKFLAKLRKALEWARDNGNPFDLVRIDPLMAFAGGDLVNPAVIASFCRGGLNSIAHDFDIGIIAVHHTPKINLTARPRMDGPEWIYAATGCADLSNWARAILVITDCGSGSGVFRLIGAKRGKRVGWRDMNGDREFERYFSHAENDGGMYWKDATLDEILTATTKPAADKKPDALQAIALKTPDEMAAHAERMLRKKAL